MHLLSLTVVGFRLLKISYKEEGFHSIKFILKKINIFLIKSWIKNGYVSHILNFG